MKIIFFIVLPGILGFPETINLRNLEDNPGLLPVKLGAVKITEYYQKVLYYYDLNPIITEFKKLKLKSINITKSIKVNYEYIDDISNYIKILQFSETKLENKLKEILPSSKRIKRGLINGLWSIFKAISGNLDTSDGEHYEKLINQLQQNQVKLANNIRTENSLAVSLIDNFNLTIQHINHNENVLENRLKQIETMVAYSINVTNSIFIKDTLNQILNMYEIITSILQDIENSIYFAKLGVMHPSIVKTSDLYEILHNVFNNLRKSQMPVDLDINKMLLFEKLIKISCFILNNKITYILHVPITLPFELDLFHLYSIPIKKESQFKVIIPENTFIIKNKLYYAFTNKPCQKLANQKYLCEETSLHEVKTSKICEIQLLNLKATSTCNQLPIDVSRSTIQRLDTTNQWILILPKEANIKLKCYQQEEMLNLAGTYLANVPKNCQITTDIETISNNGPINFESQPVLFPQTIILQRESKNGMNNISLPPINIDKLRTLRDRIIKNEPNLEESTFSSSPSVWTIILYCLLILIVLLLVYRKFRMTKRPTSTQEALNLQDVHLP